MQIVRTSKPITTTWQGRKGTVIDYHFDTQRMGKRVTVHTWADTGEVVVRTIKGDGRTAKFVQYDEQVLSASQAAKLHMPSYAEGLAQIFFTK